MAGNVSLYGKVEETIGKASTFSSEQGDDMEI
jgi:hypothetical protein